MEHFTIGGSKALENIAVDLEDLLEIAYNKSIFNNGYQNKSIEIVGTPVEGTDGIIYKIRNKHAKEFALKVKKQKYMLETHEENPYNHELEIRRQLYNRRIKGIIPTIYASTKDGILLSEWNTGCFIENQLPSKGGINKEKIESALNVLLELEMKGFFDWYVNINNILYVEDEAYLFDFGYMYTFDVLTEFNPNGIKEPYFSMFQIYQDKHLMHYVTRLEKLSQKKVAFDIYRAYITLLEKAYDKKIATLLKLGSASYIINENKRKQAFIRKVLMQDSNTAYTLKSQYIIDKYRSHKLNIESNRRGKYYNNIFLTRCHLMIELIEESYEMLKINDAFLWEDIGYKKEKLLENYQNYISDALDDYDDNPSFVY